MRGRKPKSLAQATLEGYAKCRTNFLQPILPMAKNDPPAYVSKEPEALAFWNEYSPTLIDAGLLTVGDKPAFARLCLEHAFLIKFPFDNQSSTRYRQLLVEFGMTPCSRSRIRSTAEPPKDELETFLSKKA